MSLLLLRTRKQNCFSLHKLILLGDNYTISRIQYESLYKEISMCFSIAQQIVGDKVICKIRRESVMGTREIFGKVYECPIPTSNHETYTFYIRSNNTI